MSDKETPGTPQQEHWEETYAGNPAFFGEKPSEFGLYAAVLFRREGARTILELGCGHGRDTLMFTGKGFSVTALDYSEKALEVLSSNVAGGSAPAQVSTRVFDVRRPLPFPDGSFDACYSHMLLCMELSTEELKFILGEIHRVLKVGGLALYSVRNTFDKHYRTGFHRFEDVYEVAGGFVVHFFSEEKVKNLSAGFEIQEIRRMQEGGLPRELFAVSMKKKEQAVTRSEKSGSADDAGREKKEGADMMGKFEDFFHAVYHTGVLDKKTKHLVALGASLAAACDS